MSASIKKPRICSAFLKKKKFLVVFLLNGGYSTPKRGLVGGEFATTALFCLCSSSPDGFFLLEHNRDDQNTQLYPASKWARTPRWCHGVSFWRARPWLRGRASSTSHGEREGGGLAGCRRQCGKHRWKRCEEVHFARSTFSLVMLLRINIYLLFFFWVLAFLETCAVRVRNDAQQATAAGGRTSTAAQRPSRPNEHEE